jgi:hypothetical protein
MSSGLPSKADVARCSRHVSKVPERDIVHAATRALRFGGSRGGQRQAKKGRLAPRATQSLRSTLTLQYVGTPVINLLADVPGSMRDLEPPAKMYSKAVSELRAVLEVP